MPSTHAFGIIPVFNIVLNNCSYNGNNRPLVLLIYSFKIQSVPGDFEFFRQDMHFSISADVIGGLRYSLSIGLSE